MPDVIAAVAPKREEPMMLETECPREVRAEMVSLGGGVMLFLCIVLTASAFAAHAFPDTTQAQVAILGLLAVASWLYFLDSTSERLQLIGYSVRYSSALGRSHKASLRELDSMLLVHQGFNLERGMDSIEFRRHGKPPERFALGPCWQRHKLEAFLRSVEQALRDPHLLEEVR